MFINYLESVFANVNNHIHNIKRKEIVDYSNWQLTTANFVNGLKVSLSFKKNNKSYQKILKLFDIDQAAHHLDESYNNLTDSQKEFVDPFFIMKEVDLHFYDRLYYIPVNSNKDLHTSIHDLENDVNVAGIYSELDGLKIDPNDLKLNYNEESRIEKILQILSSSKDFQQYDIFYLRNLVWTDRWGIKFAYVDVIWEFRYFFPDFLFWFLNKQTGQSTIVYFEPKSAIDPDWEKKKFVIDQKIGQNVDSCIADLFNSASAGNETFWGGRVIS